MIKAGAEGTGSTSGIIKADDPEAMIYEMISAVRAPGMNAIDSSTGFYTLKNSILTGTRRKTTWQFIET